MNTDSTKRMIEDMSIPEPNTGCWLWLGSVRFASRKQPRPRAFVGAKGVSAYRLSYEVHRGEIPAGKLICHTCDVPMCVNPDHLYVGTHKTNADDCVRRGRSFQKSKTHCANGHQFNDANTRLVRANGLTARQCRACEIERRRLKVANSIRTPRQENTSKAKLAYWREKKRAVAQMMQAAE